MSKKVVPTKKAEKSLEQKGFKKYTKKRNHFLFKYIVNGEDTGCYAQTSQSKGHDEISRDLLAANRKTLGLDNMQQAFDLLSCPMDEEEYIEILVSKEIIDANIIQKPDDNA